MPGDASIEHMLALHCALGVARVVIVHPSPYGADNASAVLEWSAKRVASLGWHVQTFTNLTLLTGAFETARQLATPSIVSRAGPAMTLRL